ncbi:MAG: PEP-CTERM sorting domain-containing protein [Alphaproteobacteria bacterium]
MGRFVPVSLVALLATGAATTAAFAGVPVTVPEPSSLALLASGMGVVYLARKLRRRK